MMDGLDKELRELRDEIEPITRRLAELRKELTAINMPDHAHGGPYVHPYGDEPDEVTTQRRRVVEVAEIKALEASVAEQERRMLEVARRQADELERDPGMLDQMIDDLYRNAGMRRPPLAAASMVLSEARCNNTVYPMGPGCGSEADHARQCSNRDRDTALTSWAAGLERSAQASARSNVNSLGGMRATGAGMGYPGRVRSTGAGLIYG